MVTAPNPWSRISQGCGFKPLERRHRSLAQVAADCLKNVLHPTTWNVARGSVRYKGSTPYPIAFAFWCSGRIQQYQQDWVTSPELYEVENNLADEILEHGLRALITASFNSPYSFEHTITWKSCKTPCGDKRSPHTRNSLACATSPAPMRRQLVIYVG
jgi:hypothetical protein